MLSIKSLKKTYASHVQALKGVSLEEICQVVAKGCRFVPFEKTEIALASLGEDANLIGAAQVWHYRFGRRATRTLRAAARISLDSRASAAILSRSSSNSLS